jgi:hypothetical protein
MFWEALAGLGFLSAFASIVFLIVGWTKRLPLEPAGYCWGLMALVMGIFELREATHRADGGKWRRSDVPVGRLSAFAFGLGGCAIGVAFLGHGWLTNRIVPGLVFFWAFVASFALGLLGQWIDGRAYEASRAAIRRRGWLLASRRADDHLPADEVHRRQEARATLGRAIQSHLTGRTTWEQVEAQYRYLADPALPAPTDWPEIADEWQAFRSAAPEGDELWGFNTVSARHGRDRGEAGYALLRDGTVVDWFITRVVG